MTSSTRSTPPPDDRSHGDAERAAPEVTVSMPAYDAAPFIRHAIESVLAQRDVGLELIVVDDGSSDDTAAIAESVPDPRLRVLRNPRRRGIGACHNIVLRHGRAPYIAHVDADDFILPGALRRMLDALADEPTAGQAHCHFFDVDREGLTSRGEFAQRWELFHRDRPPPGDYRHALKTRSAANALRTFPRRVLEELGGFDERLPFAVDYEMALRVVERHRIVLVPEFLYARRLHRTNTVASLRFKAPRLWWTNFRVRQRLIRDGRISFATDARLDLWSFLRDQGRDTVRTTHTALVRRGRRLATVARWRLWAPLSATLYRRMAERLSWWPLPAAEDRAAPAEARIAYYLRAFPASSETFIQREVSALREQGVCLDVIAEIPHDPELFDDDARAAAALAVHLDPVGTAAPAALGAFLIRRPWTVARLYAYVLFRRHGADKAFAQDRVIWQRALRLAGVLVARGATHVHAPWAFSSSVVALLGARLARVGYSVQARASDLYQDTSQQGLEERLGHADFIVTNAHYNEGAIRARLPPGATMPIHVIYEGVDLERLQPPTRRANEVPLILSVARLIEPKGLDVLLRACRILKDAGRVFRCEIVGGRSAGEMNYYLTLRKLHRALDLEADVHFLGPRPFAAVLEKYVEADVYVLPAVPASDGRRDVTPNVVIEAMAMGLPIVSSRSGAIPELIVDGVSGLLVPPRDETALAHALARLLDDAELRRRLGAAARAAAETRFDIHRNAARYAALFKSTTNSTDRCP
jgi:glycosyltransferase involved in cell wall biosynthesis